jgi:glycosyltransferase involved in cell wall biosynthesis/2-polyprenyl-3-methyl-5-hydroxy-6-metoxy-1,4-benzoquinol methylase
VERVKMGGLQIHQIHPIVSYGDAIGNELIEIREILREFGYESDIYAKSIHPKLVDIKNYADYLKISSPQNILIVHYSTEYGSELLDFIRSLPDKKILLYHNITPPVFFRNFSSAHEQATKIGLHELKHEIKNIVNVALADSEFNRQDMINIGFKKTGVLPYLINLNKFDISPNRKIIQKYSDELVNLLVIGRISPNKKVDDAIKCFYYYNKYINSKSRLLLVGSYQGMELYYNYLNNLIIKLGLKNVYFTGHINLDELISYYKIGDVFLTMSEHEGFCVPLVESMHFEVPILAYNSTAIPETLGGAGVIVNDKNYIEIAELINVLVEDKVLRNKIVKKQSERLEFFSRKRIAEILKHYIETDFKDTDSKSTIRINPDELRSEESKVDTFEIKDEEINVEEIMEKIRENIKKRRECGVYKNKSPEEIEQVLSEISSSRERIPQESEIINSTYDIRNNSYSISSHRPMMGKFLTKGRMLVHGEVRRYVDPVFQKQSELNSNLAGILSDAKERVSSCYNEMEQLRTEIEELECENITLKSKIELLDSETKKLKIESEQLKIESEQLKSEIVINVKKEVDSVISAIDLDLGNKAWLSRILETSIQKECKQVTNFPGKTDSEINYYVFEEKFRGSRENILKHQNNFIGYFINCTNVLDIGCGRGEFLELARDRGINARGIDVDEDMINFCKSKGLDAELKDAIEALCEIDDKSLDGIFISQVVEHLSPDYLINLLNLCNKKMKYGFYIIIETVNPLSLFSLANFYIDLSHVKPVHPETLRFLLNTADFRNIEIKFISPVPSEMKLQRLPDLDDLTEKSRLMIGICNQNIDMINNALYGAQDYAVIGKK